MVMQAWGNYGTVWPVVHQQLGVRPSLGYGALQVVPQVPPGQPSVAGSNIRLGSGSVDVFASHSGSRYTTEVQVRGNHKRSLEIGHTLRAGTTPLSVSIDGHPATGVDVRQTNRGVDVTVPVGTDGPHTLTVDAG